MKEEPQPASEPKTYQAHEFVYDDASIRPTGLVSTYMAGTMHEAVQHVLYATRVKDGNAYVGTTGRVVYGSGKAKAIVEFSRHDWKLDA